VRRKCYRVFLNYLLFLLKKYATILCGEFETFLTEPKGKKTKLKERQMKKRNQSTLYLTRGALIAALYVVMTLIASMMGLSSGVIQLRISEALCILPIFFPEAIPGLFVGCLISNLMVPGAVIWDIIFGSLATLIGAVGARMLKDIPEKHKWVATLPTILANVIIVPLVLIYAYNVPDGYLFLMLTVGIGEVICAGIGGSGLYYLLKRTKLPWLS
jgi:uncharacterized membrane protein